MSIKIIGNPLTSSVAAKSRASSSQAESTEEEERSEKWWSSFPSHHFSLPDINHPLPIMIKSGSLIMSFYCG